MSLKETPEEGELRRKQAELLALESTLADAELSLVSERTELRSFEARYIAAVGPLFAKLDELNAQIAERIAQRDLANMAAQNLANEARAQADLSATAIAAGLSSSESSASPRMRELYRLLAKRVHPDLARDDDDRAYRQRIMAKVNDAYERGDERALEELFEEIRSSPEAVTGGDTGSELVRTIRKIARAERRIQAIEREIESIKGSELYRLMLTVRTASWNGIDQIEGIQQSLRDSIAQAEIRLQRL